ncbi:MAG: phenylacetate--CoA ligase family protein, partial [Methanoculleus sp.]|nr:phenylacetate--CoA ligase family protein [Methanoculleus sp.]
VATNLTNFVCPLIRYRTMDLAVLGKSPCTCGRNYPLLERVEGRVQDFIVTSKGELLSGITMNIDTDAFDNVKQFQFYQERVGEVILNIVKKPAFSDLDADYLRREVGRSCGDDVTITIRYVDNIPLTARGKYRYFVQNMPIRFGERELRKNEHVPSDISA